MRAKQFYFMLSAVGLTFCIGASVSPYVTIFMRTVLDDATSAAARTTLQTELTEFAPLILIERSSDPAKPSEGYAYIWMSDGTGFGQDGDICMATTAGGVTRRAILFDVDYGDIWP